MKAALHRLGRATYKTMAKSNILTPDQKVACPHCRVPIGKVVDGELNVGFVSFTGDLSHTVKCNDCGKDFTYRPPLRVVTNNEIDGGDSSTMGERPAVAQMCRL